MAQPTKAAIKETKEEEETEETSPPTDNTLHSTRLLEKQRLIEVLDKELDEKKIEYAKKEEILQQREDKLRDRDLQLQESFIGFSQFIQENKIKKKEADKRSANEIKLRLEKEQEILQLEEGLVKLKQIRGVTLAKVDKLMIYQKYLERVLEKAPHFHEINNLLLRHATLDKSHKDLKQQLAMDTEQNYELEIEFDTYIQSTENDITMLNNEVSVAKELVEQKKIETSQLQLQIDQMLQKAADEAPARSEICTTAANLFSRIDKNSVICRQLKANPLKKLDMVADFVSDLNHIRKVYKGPYGRLHPQHNFVHVTFEHVQETSNSDSLPISSQ